MHSWFKHHWHLFRNPVKELEGQLAAMRTRAETAEAPVKELETQIRQLQIELDGWKGVE